MSSKHRRRPCFYFWANISQKGAQKIRGLIAINQLHIIKRPDTPPTDYDDIRFTTHPTKKIYMVSLNFFQNFLDHLTTFSSYNII